MGSVVLAGATSGSTTLTPTDAVTATITLPSATATLATLGANTFTGNQSITGAVTTTTVAANTATFASVGAAATQTKHFEGTGSTTAAAYGAISNTTGSIIWGVESSAGGQLITGSAAYAGALRAANGLSFSGNGGITLHANVGTGGNTSITSSTGSIPTLKLTNTTAGTPLGMQMFWTLDPNGADAQIYDTSFNSNRRIAFDSNGGIRNYSANNVNLSDIRTKDVFEDYTPEILDELEAKFMAIRRGRFKYNDQTHNDWNYGKSAQSVAEHLPELSGTWSTTRNVPVEVEKFRDGSVLDALGKPVPERYTEVEYVEEEIPESERLLCEYAHDIKEIGEALLARALKKIAELETRIAKFEATK
jgi:hypothetical protein